jgi:bacillithiol system protein YtxJ
MSVRWIELSTESQLEDLLVHSDQESQFIFKHSNRCSISAMAKSRLEKSAADLNIYIVDVIKSRPISLLIEKHFLVKHESPQLLVFKNRKIIAHFSHNAVQSLTK